MIDVANCRVCIDQPHPLFATHGGIHISGWCFDQTIETALLLQLTVADRSYRCATGVERPDVAAAFPDFPQAANSGFFLQNWMPLGYGQARFEVSVDGTDWTPLLSKPLCAEVAPLISHFDFPVSDVVDANPVTISGWALHSQEPIQELSLQIAGHSFPCHYGTPRPDVARGFPQFPHGERCGFYCRATVGVNSGPISLKARLRSGRIVIDQCSRRLTLRSDAEQSFSQLLNERRASLLAFTRCDHPTVSILIPLYDQIEVTLACLKSIAKQTEDCSYEIVVIDDNSSEETNRCLKLIEGIRLIRHESNQGFLASCNEGAAAARGEYLVFLNNDTEVTKGWLTALLRVFEHRADAGLVGAKLVYPDARLQEAGGIIFNDASGWNYGRNDHPDKPEYNYVREVDYCSGACLVVPTKLFHELGEFDPIYTPAYYEDTDLAFKVRSAGRKVYYQPLAKIIHHEGQTSGTSTESGVKRYQVVNQTKFRDKWQTALAKQFESRAENVRLAKERGVAKRALVVDARVLCPDQDSGSVRMLRMLTILKDWGFHVTFAPYNGQRVSPYTEEMQDLGIECQYDPFWINFETLFIQSEPGFDLIILSRAETAVKVLPICRKYAPRTPVIFDTVDLHFVRRHREAKLTGDRETRALAGDTELMELQVAAECDAVLVVSVDEKEVLAEKLPQQRVEVVSNIHETKASPPPRDGRKDFLFIGGFEHTPNVDAILWFAAEIMPLISKQLPDVKFHVIGSKMPDTIAALAGDRILTHGFVHNVDTFFDSCLLSVAPLRWGAGVKGKINQSMSYGLPVVSTTIGVEGMHLTHNEDVLVADSPAEFAEHIIRLHRDRALWEKLSKNGIRNIEKHFSIAAAKRNLKHVLAELGVLAGNS